MEQREIMSLVQLVQSSLVPGVVGIFTAIISVAATFYFYRVQNVIRGLRAIRTEVEENRELALHNGMGIISDIRSLEDGIESGRANVSMFSTSAYEAARNSGGLFALPDELRTGLTEHYRELNRANAAISRRQELRSGGIDSGYKEFGIDADMSALNSILMVYDPRDFRADLVEFIDEMSDGGVDSEVIIGNLDAQIERDPEEMFDVVEEKLERSKMESITRHLDKELTSYRLTKIV